MNEKDVRRPDGSLLGSQSLDRNRAAITEFDSSKRKTQTWEGPLDRRQRTGDADRQLVGLGSADDQQRSIGTHRGLSCRDNERSTRTSGGDQQSLFDQQPEGFMHRDDADGIISGQATNRWQETPVSTVDDEPLEVIGELFGFAFRFVLQSMGSKTCANKGNKPEIP